MDDTGGGTHCQQFIVAGAESTRQKAARQLAGEADRQTRKGTVYHVLALEGFLAGVCHGQNCFYMGPFSILATTWQVDLKEEKKSREER